MKEKQMECGGATMQIAKTAQEFAAPLDAIRQVIDDYHYNLDMHVHGGAAMEKAIKRIETILGAPWIEKDTGRKNAYARAVSSSRRKNDGE